MVDEDRGDVLDARRQEHRPSRHARGHVAFEFRPFLFPGAELPGVAIDDRRPPMTPDEHAGNQRCADEHRHIATVEKLEQVRGEERDVEGEEKGEQPEARPLRPAPGVTDDEVIEDRCHGHRTGDGDPVGRGKPDALAEGEHERQTANGQERIDLGNVDLPFVVASRMANRHPGEEALEHRLPCERKRARDEGLRGDHRGEAREDDKRPRGRSGRHHAEEGFGGG